MPAGMVASLLAMIAPFTCTGPAAYIGAARRQSIKPSECRTRPRQRLRRRSGGIDDHPIDRADIIFLLKPGDFGRGVGCIALAAADAAQSGGKIGYEEEADKPDIQFAGGVADRAPLRLTGKYRVSHDGMGLRKDPDSALHKGFVNLAGNLRPLLRSQKRRSF